MMNASNARIDLAEGLFRTGLLLATAFFFHEIMGTPLSRGFFGVAAYLLSLVIVSTLLLQWRVLGDWRRPWPVVLAVGLVVVLAIPIAGVFSPRLGSSLLPSFLENAIRDSLGVLAQLPGASAIGALLSGMISLMFLIVSMLVLAAGSGGRRRGGVLLIGGFLLAACLFFYPSVETIVAFLLLASFLHLSWDTPLLLPDRVLAALTPQQGYFLRQLQKEGALTTGETRLYLDNDAASFGQLVELKLVHYDNVAREVVPGPRLSHDPAAQTLEAGFSYIRRAGWFLLGITYFIMPDFIPGPIDDFIVLAITTGIGSGLFKHLFPPKR